MADKTTKVKTVLKHEAGISTELAEELSFGQAHWWLRQRGGEFVKIPKRVRGDRALDLKIELEPGSYVLGVGTMPDGVREDIEVEATSAATASKAENIKGKCFVFTGDMSCMGRDEAKELLATLGARATGSVSGKTDYLVVGEEPGQKKIEKAKSLGTQILDEKAFVELAGITVEKVAAAASGAGGSAEAYLKRVSLSEKSRAAAEKVASPKHFADLGQVGDVIWGIAVGPRGGRYAVHIDMKKKNPRYAAQCNCSASQRPCKHAVALLMTAANHWIPPAPAPAGHREEAEDRYSFWE